MELSKYQKMTELFWRHQFQQQITTPTHKLILTITVTVNIILKLQLENQK